MCRVLVDDETNGGWFFVLLGFDGSLGNGFRIQVNRLESHHLVHGYSKK